MPDVDERLDGSSPGSVPPGKPCSKGLIIKVERTHQTGKARDSRIKPKAAPPRVWLRPESGNRGSHADTRNPVLFVNVLDDISFVPGREIQSMSAIRPFLRQEPFKRSPIDRMMCDPKRSRRPNWPPNRPWAHSVTAAEADNVLDKQEVAVGRFLLII